MRSPRACPTPHPLFGRGEVISWGLNYSSEKGVAFSAPSGLLVQTCKFEERCAASYMGERACGRFPYGPFDWTWMGHNRDLAPHNANGRAAVHFRTTATRVMSVFERTTGWQVPTADVKVEVALLGADLEPRTTVHCATQKLGEHPVAVCSLPPLRPGADCEGKEAEGALPCMHHVEMRIDGPKSTALKQTIFS